MAFDLTLEPGAGELPVFIGPKDRDVLDGVHPQLWEAIDFGFLSPIVAPLHRTLKWINGSVGNYGWSIILLTVLINILIFPLRHKSVVSMRKMQELQPEMKAIQARYANLKATDPGKQKMNQEVMELYRTHGVNPASGCLPMLLTMPVLIAFYRLLSMAVELRGAPFTLWISDLSVQDPLYITPVVMGASMVFQQRLQPAGTDPMQQKIMMLMPVMFTVMFLWAPSGLVIYWLTSNIFNIGQQLVTNKIAGPPRTRQVRPPAERQVKKVTGVVVDAEPSGNGSGTGTRRGSRRRSRARARVRVGPAGKDTSVTADLETRMVTFVEAVTTTMGLSLEVACTAIEDGTRITIDGDEGELLLRRKGAGLDALQHIVNAVFRSEHTKGHIVVDCLDYRRGKDDELRQTALLLAERARATGETQEIGPLNPYARRIVHLAVAEDATVSSESIGDAFLKTVLISANEPTRPD